MFSSSSRQFHSHFQFGRKNRKYPKRVVILRNCKLTSFAKSEFSTSAIVICKSPYSQFSRQNWFKVPNGVENEPDDIKFSHKTNSTVAKQLILRVSHICYSTKCEHFSQWYSGVPYMRFWGENGNNKGHLTGLMSRPQEQREALSDQTKPNFRPTMAKVMIAVNQNSQHAVFTRASEFAIIKGAPSTRK